MHKILSLQSKNAADFQHLGGNVIFVPCTFDGIGPEVMAELYQQHRAWALESFRSLDAKLATIDELISKIPDLKFVPTSRYCQLRNNHIEYVLRSLKSLTLHDYRWMYSGLEEQSISLEGLEKVYRPIQDILDSLSDREHYLLTVTAYLHDMYYRFVDHATADHGIKGADYLAAHPEELEKYGLTLEEQTLVISLIRYHSAHLDIGGDQLPDDIACWPQSSLYQKMALLISFVDLAKPHQNGKYRNCATPRVAHYLAHIANQIPDILSHRDQFYQLRLHSFLTPVAFFKLPDSVYQQVLNQLNAQPDAAELKQFLNESLYVETTILFEKMYRISSIFSKNEHGEKDFTTFFILLRRLRQLAIENQLQKVSLYLKHEKSTYETGLHQDQEPLIRFAQKLQQPGDAWRACFEIVPSLNQVWIQL